ncbi:NAD(P)/FAD-dependent oxidoreductase [Leptolyngbya cf. ectocarpi LEGE 11479]|uniref:NAD(P)/FAD-dependent oxidoreductase n=1 Tax=Leptolyngbya cf. ectocarpi LEGE 11479 TaxID=1828722 RepID=A0A928X3N7_LEPEC|nr:NAD(P)/FAD-dependent oxidoreductase [Leptolyngbya ectocarpi]MBE9066483.1 NAD(P)/FAD-dependent oxidoreductase [Leptolyngbya cf. ectocarpi LEGE 11479]
MAIQTDNTLSQKTHYPTIIIGAGPAGLTTAYQLTKAQTSSLVLEQAGQVGGIARTESYKGYRFDIGGHRFFTKLTAVQQFWEEILGQDLLKVSRLSRIYYNDIFFNYPLTLFDTLFKLGVVESIRIIGSYIKTQLKAQFSRSTKPETFEDWVSYHFGGRLFQTFFRTYTEKVWGISCKELQADWAAQRIQGLSLTKAVVDTLIRNRDTKTLIKSFYYPRLGPGMLWERCHQKVIAQGGTVTLETSVKCLKHKNNRVQQVIAHTAGTQITFTGDHFVSSMPITALVKVLDPPAPVPVLQAAKSLKYRDFLLVALILDEADVFPDNWIYIHSPEVHVGRIQNFKNWSIEMVPDPSKTCLGLEYFCNETDEIWHYSDASLVEIAIRELVTLGLLTKDSIIDGKVLRQRKAYPIYDRNYHRHLETIQTYLATFENLQTIGRNGMHRYNNQDHSMMAGILAAQNILGDSHNLWQINTEATYHEAGYTQAKSAVSPVSDNPSEERAKPILNVAYISNAE